MSIALIFIICFSVMLVSSAMMNALEKKFITHDVTDRSFSIIDLQFPVDNKELLILIRGLYRLPAEVSDMSIRALKAQLWVDFIFIPALYGSVFLLCMTAAHHLTGGWMTFFLVLAWLQVLALLCDLAENIFLFVTIRPDLKDNEIAGFSFYQIVVYTKWMIVLTGSVCVLSAFFYFLLQGQYNGRWYLYLTLVVAEIILFIKLRSKKIQP